MSVNKAILLGHVGRDPELRSLPSGGAVANFSLATSRRWKDKSGEKQEQTEWHQIVAFGRTAEVVGQYVHKGSKLYVEGRIQTRSWDDKQSGEKKYRTEIVADNVTFLGDPTGERAETQEGASGTYGGGYGGEDDSDIPFVAFLPLLASGLAALFGVGA
jgi:single-strand DNA-binding protein